MKFGQRLLLLTTIFYTVTFQLRAMNQPNNSGINLNNTAQAFATFIGGVGTAIGNGLQVPIAAAERLYKERQARFDRDKQQKEFERAALEIQKTSLTKAINTTELNKQASDADKLVLLQNKQQLEFINKKLDAIEQYLAKEQQKVDRVAGLQDEALDIGVNQAKMTQTVFFESIRAEIRAKEHAAKAAADAEGKKGAARVAVQEVFIGFAQPKNIGLAGLWALAIFGAYFGLKFSAQVLDDWYRIPTLADKTTILSPYQKLYNWLFDIEVFSATRNDIILAPETEAFFNEYIEATKNTLENGGYLRSLLLPGPSGTGKTLMSIVLANELGLPAIYFAASNLRNYKVEDAITKLRQLFAYAESSPVPIVIIIDEAEVIFANRENKDKLSEEIRLIMNKIMAQTGTEQSNFILIGLTNRPQDFDSAFQSRFSEMIYINPPTLQQRTDILSMYIDKYLVHPIFPEKSGWFTKKAPKPIMIDNGLFTKEAIENMSKQLDTFTGRDISQLVMALRDAAMATKDARLTKEMVDRVVQRKIEKKQKEKVFTAASNK